jgi:hypothetical protein
MILITLTLSKMRAPPILLDFDSENVVFAIDTESKVNKAAAPPLTA